jgi:hypothetical protein
MIGMTEYRMANTGNLRFLCCLLLKIPTEGNKANEGFADPIPLFVSFAAFCKKFLARDVRGATTNGFAAVESRKAPWAPRVPLPR